MSADCDARASIEAKKKEAPAKRTVKRVRCTRKERVLGQTCDGFQRCLVLNSTHDFVIFPSASGLGKICSQDGRASDSERASTHLSCSAMGTID